MYRYVSKSFLFMQKLLSCELIQHKPIVLFIFVQLEFVWRKLELGVTSV